MPRSEDWRSPPPPSQSCSSRAGCTETRWCINCGTSRRSARGHSTSASHSSYFFALAWIAQRTDTSILIAGFAVGLLVAVIGGPKRLTTQVTGIAAGFFVPLFFVALGARLDLRAVFEHANTLALAGLLVAATVAAHLASALITRQPPAAGLAATAQLGLPAGVATLGLQQHSLSPGRAAAIVLAALASIAISPVGVALLARRGKGEPRKEVKLSPAAEPPPAPPVP